MSRSWLMVLALALSGLASCSSPREMAPTAAGDPELVSRIDEHLEALVQNGDLSGVVLVADDEQFLYERAFGTADAATGQPNGLDLRFGIASLTKTVTAGATLIAIQDGLLEPSDTLPRFGLDFPRADEITVRHLLAHSSGLSNPDYVRSFSARITPEELIRAIVDQPLQFEPGTEHRYSNAGYNVLTQVIREASGLSYDAFLAERIFGPLEMTATGHVEPDTIGVGAGHVPGPTGPVRTPPYDAGFSYGSGSLYASAPDLLRWARAVGDERLFAWRSEDWPWGWGKVEIGGRHGIEQTGATTGYMSSLLVFPDDGLFVVALWNQEVGRWVQLGRDLAALALGEPTEPWPRRQTVALEPDGVARYAGRFVDDGSVVEVVAEDGHLWLYSGDWPVGKYLAPRSPTEFEVPSDMGTVVFRGAADDGFGELYWDFGESGRAYVREE